MNLLANGNTKDNSCDTFKEMDPFPPFISLSSNIEESIYFSAFLIFSNRAAQIIANI